MGVVKHAAAVNNGGGLVTRLENFVRSKIAIGSTGHEFGDGGLIDLNKKAQVW